MKRTTQVAATVTEEERALIKEAAKTVDLTVSELIRRAAFAEVARIAEEMDAENPEQEAEDDA